MAPRETTPIYRFGRFEAHTGTGELLCDGEKVHLVGKAFQVLAALLACPGEVVSRDMLFRRLWSPDTFVDFDNNLNAAVRRLRDALGDSATAPQFVETLPRRGYRFVAPVEVMPPRALPRPGEMLDRPLGDTPAGGRGSRWGSWSSMAAGLVVLSTLAAFGWLVGRPAASEPQEKKVLAVLPFANIDRDPERDYLSDGMTEELITHLGRLSPEHLGVIARVSALSFKGSDQSADVIGRALRADFVLEGSVRGDAERVRVVARLIQVSDATHLWTEAYDGDLGDVLALQADIAKRVARSLAVELLRDDREAVARSATTVTAAYEAYLRGRHQWRRFTAEGYRHATAHFGQAVALDPSFAQAHAGLADAYNLLAFDGMPPTEALPRAAAAARRALALDPLLAEAHNALAFSLLYYDFDPEAAHRAFTEAHRLSPGYAMAYHWHAGALSALARHDEAIAAVEKALSLDPASLSVQSDLGWYYLYADRYREGLAICEGALAIDPHYGWASACRAVALERLGEIDSLLGQTHDPPEAHRAGAKPERLDQPGTARALAALHRAHLERLQARIADDPLSASAVLIAMAHAAVGERDHAFEWLDRAVGRRDGWLVFLRVDPRFDPLHDDPRFEALCQRVGV